MTKAEKRNNDVTTTNHSRDVNHNYDFLDNGTTMMQPQEYDEEIELVVQGREILVKECLLVQHSMYFSQVFGDLDPAAETVVLRHGLLSASGTPSSDGDDDEEEEQPMEVVEEEEEPLTMISYATMRSIVDFLQTGAMKIGDANIKQLMLASELLLIGSVQEQCFNFLQSNLTLQNCVRHFVLADAKPSWAAMARRLARFIQLRFDAVMQQTQLYQLTDARQFRRLICDECLTVEREEKVWEAVKEWVEYGDTVDDGYGEGNLRRQHLYTLMSEVQWPLVKEESAMLQAMRDPMVASDMSCVGIIKEALRYRRMSYDDKVVYWRTRQKPSRWPKLLAALAYADKMIECFDFEELRWFPLTMKPGASFGAEMCYAKGKLYTLGGVQAKQVDQYDVESNVWTEGGFPEMTQFRVAHGVVSVGARIFVMGGSAKASADFGPGLDEMETLDCERSEGGWTRVSSMAIGRSYLASAACDGKIYAVAGCLTEGSSTAEVYHIGKNRWRGMAGTLTKRDSLGLAAIDGQLFAVGGFNNIENAYLNSVERYDPSRDVWTAAKPMLVARRSPGVVVYKCRLYAVGGMGQTEDLRSVEVYDPLADTWSRFPYPTKEVYGWTTCSLLEKPLRMMESRSDAAGAAGSDVAMFNGKPISNGKTNQKKSTGNLNAVPTDSQRSNNLGGVKRHK